ncbi:uncharacterized protein RHIMIDRAFT_257903 [Rhizopus microsporus ATCC 52813]|uniref:Uncharacterized protein n=1 Tax=Rhizopus microsporus ATCC 52813 TaxID=1340429 RepID=A0A2G4SPW6_RHIZD|nr:uncharacterized protein RHIMIDRAFT_257903 [Rhizopus microsporus ATCC 52813]PHZ10818.1 hypothetical protein RHIMIDRAFT_257903 [Rhizopus microsporus ATCC 52813]
MKRKMTTLRLQRQSETKGKISVDRGFPSLFSQTQTNLQAIMTIKALYYLEKIKITSISFICFITECCNRQEHLCYFESC